jgi:hypothetical protein
VLDIDEERKQISCGLVDTIGSYTFAKTLEYKAKELSGKEGKNMRLSFRVLTRTKRSQTSQPLLSYLISLTGGLFSGRCLVLMERESRLVGALWTPSAVILLRRLWTRSTRQGTFEERKQRYHGYPPSRVPRMFCVRFG